MPCRQNDDSAAGGSGAGMARRAKPIFLVAEGSLRKRARTGSAHSEGIFAATSRFESGDLRALHVERHIAAARGCDDAKTHERRPIRPGSRERIARAHRGVAFEGSSASSLAGFATSRISAGTKLSFASAI